MLPLHLMGIDMADEASESFGGGVRNWLGAVGFCAVLIGAEMLRENTAPIWIGTLLIIIGLAIFLLPFVWRRIKKESPENPPKLAYLTYVDSELGAAIKSMARYSAYGKWYAAQVLVNGGKPATERELIFVATGQVMEEILNGKLDVRGRLPGRMDYELIDRTYWRSSGLTFIADPVSLWKMVIIPRGGAQIEPSGNVIANNAEAAARTAEIARYDSLIVNANQFEEVWPKRDPVADKARRKFLRQARKRGLDENEIERLSR
jgi:hypothetical protein